MFELMILGSALPADLWACLSSSRFTEFFLKWDFASKTRTILTFIVYDIAALYIDVAGFRSTILVSIDAEIDA